MCPLGVLGASEQTFDVLQIGTRSYTNVTVTTKAKSYIFMLYAGGMTSLKVAELPSEIKQKLGYGAPPESKGGPKAAAAWAKKELARMGGPQIKDMTQNLWKELDQRSGGLTAARLAALGLIGPKPNWTLWAILLLLYFFYSYCCMLICRKARYEPSVLVWLPLLKLFPMLRAARMSGWWFLAYFVPVINLIPLILWPLKIARARGKSAWVGVLLFLPGLNFFAFLYLAFSNAAPGDEEEDDPESKIMTLQTA